MAEFINKIKLDTGELITRSAANCEDAENQTLAKVFESVYFKSAVNIENSIKFIYDLSVFKNTNEVLKSFGDNPRMIKMGIII